LAKGFIREQGGSCIVTVDVVPGAPKSELGKVNEWRGALQVKVAAQPREGGANDELVRFLAERLGVPKDSVRILKGETSRHKTIGIDAPKEKVERLLGVGRC
jgi:uncharacterized protein (TIGR00251 family)